MKVGKWLAHVITQEQDDHEGATDPYRASNGISIPCLCVITSHTLHFLSLLTYADPIFKVRARTKHRNGFFPPVSLLLCSANVRVFIFIYLTCLKLL